MPEKEKIEVKNGKSRLEGISEGSILDKGHGVKELVIEKTPDKIKTLRRISGSIYEINYLPIGNGDEKYLKLDSYAIYEEGEAYEKLNQRLLKAEL